MSNEENRFSFTGFIVYGIIGFILGAVGGFALFMREGADFGLSLEMGYILIAGIALFCALIAAITGGFTWNKPPRYY